MKKIPFISLLLFFFTSCIPYRYLGIEFYDAPDKPIRAYGQNILVLNNLHARQTSTALEQLDWALDSISSVEATNALMLMIQQSPWFEGSSVAQQAIVRSDTSKVIQPLSWNILDSLSGYYNSPWIISLEYLKVKPYYDTYPQWRNDFKEYYGYIDVSIYAYWRIYDLNDRKIFLGQLYTDTLSWEGTDWVAVTPGNQLPGVFEVCAYAGADAGEHFGSSIAPTWQKAIRVVFVHGSSMHMKKAYALAVKGKWLDAASIWQPLTYADNNKLASQAAFNMALANEMNGKYDVALEWLEFALKKNPKLAHLNEYYQVLSTRISRNKIK